MNENRKHAGGRPKAQNPLDIDVKVRLDALTAAELDRYCDRHNTRRAAAIRSAVLAMLAEDARRAQK